MKCLVFGHTGWIGSQVIELLKQQNCGLILSSARLDNYKDIVSEFEKYPDITHCLLAAGLTGRPNVDALETMHIETIQVNVIGTSIVADMCNRRNIHLTFLSTGCIFEYSPEHPIGGSGFTEEDTPNFDKSFYSYTKIITEKIVKEFPTTLVLRIRMPISDDKNPRNFITKIVSYKNVVNIPNSMTVLHDLLPLIPDMMSRRLTGIINFCNPGVISHNDILNLYIKYIDPDFKYTNFSLEEQAKVIKAGRSNNCLDCSKLLSYYPHVPHIQDSIIEVFKRMQKNLNIQDSL